VIRPSARNAASVTRAMPERARPSQGRSAVSAPEPPAYHNSARHPSTSPIAATSVGGAIRIAKTPVAKAVKSATARASGASPATRSARICHSGREPERADELARRRLEPDADREGHDAERDREREAEREEQDPADEPHFGCIRSAPSRRIEQPLSMSFSTIARTSAAYSSARPRRDGNGTLAARLLRKSSGTLSNIGV